ncbi:MAG: hypothetical protein AB1508_07880 [Pseudomonadota bacterium]
MPYVRSTFLKLAIAAALLYLNGLAFGVPGDSDDFVLSQYLTREKYRHNAEQNLRHPKPQGLGPAVEAR